MKSFLEEMTRPAIQLSPVPKVQIKIDHDVPLPTAGRGAASALRSLMKSMLIGDSFVWSGSRNEPYYVAKTLGISVYSQKTNQGTTRIWRIG